MSEPAEVETLNDSMVAVKGERIVILRPRVELSKQEALRLAAWVVALADDDDKFPVLLEAVRNT
jgi:hypothetical protein